MGDKFVTWANVGIMLEGIRRKLVPYFGSISLDFNETVMLGHTFDNGSSPLIFSIGVREIVESPSEKVPIGKAMVPIVNLFHEVCGHGGQLLEEFQKTNALSLTLAMNYYACFSSSCYYGFDTHDRVCSRYFHQPHEVAAQYMGIKSAFDYLCSVVDKDMAEYMMLSYVDYRLKNQSEFIDAMPQERTVESVLNAFSDRYVRDVYRQREYDVMSGFDMKSNLFAKVERGSKFAEHQDFLHLYSDSVGVRSLPGRVKACKSGFKQDAMMVSAFLVCDKGLRECVLSLPVFEGSNMNPANIFKQFGHVDLVKPKKQDLDLKLLSTFDDIFLSNGNAVHGDAHENIFEDEQLP